MAQSVSNEALWVKLSEIDKKLDELSEEQGSPVPTREPIGNKPDFTAVKEEIMAAIEEQTLIIGGHSDSNFEANRKNIGAMTETIQKVWNIVSRIRKQQREDSESQGKGKEYYFNFYFFKARKTAVVITLLALLVLLLMLFCMKQQNDYSLLLDEYYRQSVEVRKTQAEVDSLTNATKTYTDKKQK